MKKIDCVYHLETNDPDDYMTLCLLSTHPKVNLKAITIDPGAPEQVAIVKYVLNKTGRTDVRVGVPDNKKYTFPNRKDPVVSGFHYKIILQLKPDYSAELSDKVLYETFKQYPDTVLLTGAPVTGIASFLKKHPDITIKKWVAQGGFAGTNLVAKENVLAKFAGQEVCRTFNFCQDINAADYLLNNKNITEKYLVSKNVCHGVTYDKTMHNKIASISKTKGLDLIYTAMDKYLENKPKGKMFHDPFAACVMINPDICEFKEVEVYHKLDQGHQKYGANLKAGTNTFISISADHNLFFDTLIEHA